MKTIFQIYLFIILFFTSNISLRADDKSQYKLAQTQFQNKEYVKCIQTIQSLSNNFITNETKTYYYLIASYTNIGALHKAYDVLNKAPKPIPTPKGQQSIESLESYIKTGVEKYKGLIYQLNNANTPSIEILAYINEAIAIDSFEITGYFYRGLVFYDLKNYISAEKDLQKAVINQYNHHHLYYYYGLCQSKLGNSKEAVYYYTKCLETNNDGEIYYNRGVDYYILKEYTLCRRDMEKAALIDKEIKNTKDVYYYLGFSSLYENDTKKSIAYFSKYISLTDSSNVYILNGLGKSYFYERKYSSAIPCFNITMTSKIISIKSQAYYYKSQCLFYTTDIHFDKPSLVPIVKLLDEAIKLDSTNSEYYYRRGLTKKYQNKYTEGIIDLNKSITYDSLNFEAYDERYTCQELMNAPYRIRKRDLYEAINIFKKEFTKSQQANYQYAIYIAEFYDQIEYFDKQTAYLDTALYFINQALIKNPNQPNLVIEKVKLHRARLEDIDVINTGLLITSNEENKYICEVGYSMFFAYRALKRYDEGYQMLKRLETNCPNSFDKSLYKEFLPNYTPK